MIVVEAGDTVEALIGFSCLFSPLRDADGELPMDWIIDHGSCFEAGFVVSDDGAGFSLIVPRSGDLPSALVGACLRQAVIAAAED